MNAPRMFVRRGPARSVICGEVARTRHSASTTGQPSRSARSRAWLNPRRSRRQGCSGTGTAMSHVPSRSWPASRIIDASGDASERRPSYLNACITSHNTPSYRPPARPASMNGLVQVASTAGRTALRQTGHKQPRDGASSGDRQAAQAGASTAASSASTLVRRIRVARRCPRAVPARRSRGTPC